MPPTPLLPPLLIFTLAFSNSMRPSSPAPDSAVYVACSGHRYPPASLYHSNLNSLLAALLSASASASASASYANFTVHGGSDPSDTVHALYQCRGDLTATPDCRRCVAASLRRLPTLCPNARAAALQLDGCFLRYDAAAFLGMADATVLHRKCGAPAPSDSDGLARRDAVLGSIAGDSGRLFRSGGSGPVRGAAQCTGDLSPSACQDCVAEGIGRLKSECGAAEWGDMFLATCYARYWVGGDHSRDGCDVNDEEIKKTLAILIGLIAGVGAVIVLIAFLTKVFGRKSEK